MTRRANQPKQLTIRGFDPEVEDELRGLVKRERLSLNQAVMQLLRRAIGRRDVGDRGDRVGPALDDLAGTWSTREAREFSDAIEPLERVDETFWQTSSPRARQRS